MTPALRTVDAANVPPQPWRNGGGVTRELLAWPAGAAWTLRLSLADIAADGPFSRFDGVVRWFAVVSGRGVVLTLDGAPQRLAPGDAPLRFDGAQRVGCRLVDGPTRDLNLMLRGRPGALLPAVPGEGWTPPAEAVAAGLVTARPGRCGGHALPAQALLWMDCTEALPTTLCVEPDTDTHTVTDTNSADAAPAGWWWWAGAPDSATKDPR